MSEPVAFLGRAEPLIGSPQMTALQAGVDRFSTGRDTATAEFVAMEELRDRARAIRLHALQHLDRLLGHFATQLEAAGSHVHFASDAEEANQIIVDILEASEARLVVKSKSMVTEEIELRGFLESRRFEVVETDLGEFIAQLADQMPSHIIAPVIHMTRHDVAAIFEEKLGFQYTDDPSELNLIARGHLREIFLRADAGISGVNVAVAESGSVVLVTNEGNGRLTTTAPKLHIAVMGMERIVPRWEDAATVLEVLARSATGQRQSVYTNVLTGPRREGDHDGPDEQHVVIIDNGRSEILGGPTAEILACIRCGACLNVCPVFRTVGGHGYGTVYPGPFGSIVTPGLQGMEPWWELPYASTLCGACEEVCPIRIQIPKMLLNLREQAANESRLPGWLEKGMGRYAAAATDPGRWSRAKKLAGWMSLPLASRGWIRRMPGPARGWTDHRDMPRPSTQSFADWWEKNRGS